MSPAAATKIKKGRQKRSMVPVASGHDVFVAKFTVSGFRVVQSVKHVVAREATTGAVRPLCIHPCPVSRPPIGCTGAISHGLVIATFCSSAD